LLERILAGLDFLGTAWLIFCLTKFLAHLFVFSSFDFYFQVLLNCFQGKEYYSFLFIDFWMSVACCSWGLSTALGFCYFILKLSLVDFPEELAFLIKSFSKGYFL